jgi:alpha-galactosidase
MRRTRRDMMGEQTFMTVRTVLLWTGLLAPAIAAHCATASREDFRLAERFHLRMQAAEPFSFVYGSESSRQLLRQWTVRRSERRLDAARIERRATYRDPRTGLELEWTLIEYATFPAFEWVLRFKNTATKDTLVLEEIRALDAIVTETAPGAVPKLEYAEGSHDELSDFAPGERALAQGESAQFVSRGGRSSDGYLPFFQVRNPRGGNVVAGIGWTGQWSACFRHVPARGIAAAAGMERTRLRLRPGESVRTPAILLLCWSGDDAFRGNNLWRSLLLKHYTPRPNGAELDPPLAVSAHGVVPFERTTEANMLEGIEQVSREKLGAKIWWIDTGWFSLIGNNWAKSVGNFAPDPVRYPRGLKPVADAAHRHGMKFLLWFEPERAMPGTWLFEHHRDWLLKPSSETPYEYGYMVKDRFHLLDLSNLEALAWLRQTVAGMISENGIDIYRQDFNMYPLWYWRAGEAGDRQGLREAHYIENLYAFWDELIRRSPGLLIDNCASGGRRLDFEMLRRSVALWRSDTAWKDIDALQSMTYGLSRWIPIHGLGAISTEPYDFRSAMAPTFTSAIDYRKADAVRRARPMLEAYRSIQKRYQGDFYPLTPYSRGADVWMAWQFHREELGDGVVQAFRRKQCAQASATYRLHGLEPRATYRITDWDRPGEKLVSGRELMESGLTFQLAAPRSAAVVEYRKRIE